MLELTTRFVGITTGKRANGKQLSSKSAAAQAKANLRYILRESATTRDDLITLNITEQREGRHIDRRQLQQHLARDIESRATSGGKRGTRVAEKIIFSLPNDMLGAPAREAVKLVAQRMAKGSPNVKVVAAIHTDRPNNLHVHMLILDGLETIETAKARTSPKTKRVRQQYVLRMGDRGRPKEMRRLIATAINDVSTQYGLSKVEARSYRERGIQKLRQSHDGPQKRARIAKAALDAFWIDDSVQSIKDIFSDPEPEARAAPDPSVDTFDDLMQFARTSFKTARRGMGR